MSHLRSWNGFIGQGHVVTHLQTQLRGAQALGQPCPHMLFIGPSGMGKTRLAQALSQEAGTALHVVHGAAKAAQLCSELTKLEKGDFILFDEAHALPREAQESLYEAIDFNLLTDRLSMAQSSGQQVNLPTKNAAGKFVLPPITMVFATNQPSRLLKALHRRMQIRVYLNQYAEEEIGSIAAAEASTQGLLLAPFALQRLARAAQGQPGRVINMVRGLRRHFFADQRQLESVDVVAYLHSTGSDALGLDREQQLYLFSLQKLGGRASIHTLSGMLGLDREYVEDKIETGLLQQTLVTKGMAGRHLTNEGNLWLQNQGLQNQGIPPNPMAAPLAGPSTGLDEASGT